MTDYVVNPGDYGVEPYASTPGQVDTIRFADNIGRAQFISDGGSEVRVTIDGSVPTFNQPGASTSSFRMPAGTASTFDFPMAGAPDVIRLMTAGTALVSVQALV